LRPEVSYGGVLDGPAWYWVWRLASRVL
jgi:hypothetical protein